jgi:hypothetical protein
MKPNEIEELRQTLGSVATRAMAVGAQSVGALTRENQTRGNWRVTRDVCT